MQVDHDARKEWDAYVVKLATVDKDPASGCEVIHWIMKYPVSNSLRFLWGGGEDGCICKLF